jgi:hypothetical protein
MSKVEISGPDLRNVLKREEIGSSKTSVTFYRTAWRRMPIDSISTNGNVFLEGLVEMLNVV